MGSVGVGFSMSLDGYIAGPNDDVERLFARMFSSDTDLKLSTKEGSPFTFVTDGIESAVAKAKAIAGDKSVGVAGADVAQQCIRAGLLDVIHVDLVTVLLGDGIRLFENLGSDVPIELESTNVVEDVGVTHLTYRIVK